VTVGIDNQPSTTVTNGDVLKLDEHEHALHFGCVANVCEQLTRMIAAGKDDATLSVELQKKKATLTVRSKDANASFGFVESPSAIIRPGVPFSFDVPPSRVVTLFDRSNPSRTQPVGPLNPGEQREVDFGP
jgi:hypothetical protein